MKNNLPVILLRGLVLLPYNDIKLEFENDGSRNVIDVAELFHDNNLLVVTQPNPYEENPDINDLPNIGIVAKITHKMVLPNGKIRVIISGIKRSRVYEYLNLNHNNGVLESIVTDINQEQIDNIEETAIIRKLNKELDCYVRNVPYMGNSVMGQLISIKELGKYTDVLAPSLPIKIDRLTEYLKEEKPSERARMILLDIYKEQELFNIEKDLDVKVKRELDDSQRDFILREKLKTIKEELNEVSTKEEEVDQLKKKLEKCCAPNDVKGRIEKEIDRYANMTIQSPEISIIRNYIDWLLDLPWNIETIDNENLKEVEKKLDESHDGLEQVKSRILEYLAVKKTTHSLKSPIICLVGPPGVGKTSLAKSISKAIDRNFVKISVGGMSDESEITGHRRTYLGAAPGRIIESMKKAHSSNPVFLIDEIDKMTHDIKGDPASALLSVLDPEQNKYFSDNYIEEEYDLSNVMFIATANNIDNIPAPLKDRLEIINVSGYTEYEKLDIAKKHLIPKICKENGLDNIVKFKDDAILKVIRSYTKEAGVRELERILSSIVRKIITSMVMNNSKEPTSLTPKNIEKYLGRPKYTNIIVSSKIGMVNGLAYTNYGGVVLAIEVNYYKGHGNLILTGSLGEVMKESAQIALSYIKSNYKKFNIDYAILEENDIHIHVAEGAVPKEGPSAGIALTSALISSLSKVKVKSNIALTGEITLHGDVLPIGGLKEKSLGAYRNGINTIIFPHDNIPDLDDIPTEIKDNMIFISVKNYDEVFKIIKEAK